MSKMQYTCVCTKMSTWAKIMLIMVAVINACMDSEYSEYHS